MKISIATVFPELYNAFLSTSLIKRAQDAGIVKADVISLFSFVDPKKRIDAPVCGPGAGMLIKPTVIEAALDAQEKKWGKAYTIMFSPHGTTLSQDKVRQIVDRIGAEGHCLLIPARYEGMDARVEEEYADEILSIGDYVLMGGDIPAMAFLEAMLRLVPGVVGKTESVDADSYSGPFVDYPEYTEPLEWHGKSVPAIVRSGNHEAIAQWRKERAIERTLSGHFDWLRSASLTDQDKKLVLDKIPPHYVALLHGEVLVGKDRMPGCTSVTSVDIHDIARSSMTYGIKNYFIVSPLIDQQKIVTKFLSFWHYGPGERYNKNRYDAVRRVEVVSNLAAVVEHIFEKEGKRPLIISTSAQKMDPSKTIGYYDQDKMWAYNRPVLLVFGTGQGLDDSVIVASDYVLGPVEGLSDFNHLSVRSAAAIILDRWLGLNKRLNR